MNIATSYITNSFMSIFILGVLTGWLVEWIFYNLFWKHSANNKITKNTSETPSLNKVLKETKDSKQNADSAKDRKTEEKQIKSKSGSKKEKQQPDPKNKSERSDKSEKEKQQAKIKGKAEISTKDQQELTQKADTKDILTEEDQAAEKKPLAKTEEKPPVKKAKKATNLAAKTDDLTKLYGVGPSIAQSLKEIGVNSFKQLSESNADELIEKLIANGTKIINKTAMESWAEQAKFADANDLDGLKAFQDELKKS
jgi:predicted flap endonuclease-1-like 5' DNA nuclease